MRRASLQVKFGLSYILVIAAVLVFMNTYPLIVSENLVVRSKQTTLQSSVSVMVTALSGLEELSEENVASAMTLVEDTGISRILVTDAAGRILYDTRETDGAVGRYGLYTEIVQALRGYDAFYADFTDGAFRSRAASPVIYHSQTIGAVYAYEYDVEQATLLLTLQKNLLRISLIRALSGACGMTRVEQKNGCVVMIPRMMQLPVWAELSHIYSGKLLVSLGAQPYVTYRIRNGVDTLSLLCEIFAKYIQVQEETALKATDS